MSKPDTAKAKIPIIVVSLVLIPFVGWMTFEHFVDMRFKPIDVAGTLQAKEIPVASKIGGRISKVCVQEGQMVKSGQVLIEFEAPELIAKRNMLAAQIAEGEAHLLELQNGPRREEIQKARSAMDHARSNWQLQKHGYRAEDIQSALEQVEQHEVQVLWAEKEFKRYKGLSELGAVARRDAEDLRAKADVARNMLDAAKQNYAKMTRGPREEEIQMAWHQYEQAKAHLLLLEHGTRFEQLKQAESKLDQAKALLEEVDHNLRESQVVSPADAEVSVMDLHAGEVFMSNKNVATLTRLDDLWTRVYIPERELSRVRVGQQVSLKVDAYPNKTFSGRIVQIPGVAEFTPRNVQTPEERSAQVFGVKVKIDNKDLLLRGGMNATITLPPVDDSTVSLR